MEFNDFNLKLVVLNELIALGLLEDQLAPIYEKQRNGYYEKHYEALGNRNSAFDGEWDDPDDDLFEDGADDYYYPHPEMEEEIAALELTEGLLAHIEKLDLDYGEIQGMLSPHWHGEDELFQVSDLGDLRALPNLQHIEFSFALDPEIKSLEPLLELPALKKITTVSVLEPAYFFGDHAGTRSRLEAKGVKIQRGK